MSVKPDTQWQWTCEECGETGLMTGGEIFTPDESSFDRHLWRKHPPKSIFDIQPTALVSPIESTPIQQNSPEEAQK